MQYDRIRSREVSIYEFRNLLKCYAVCAKDLRTSNVGWNDRLCSLTHQSQFVVGMNDSTVRLVLKSLQFDVIPQRLNDAESGIFFYPQYMSCENGQPH